MDQAGLTLHAKALKVRDHNANNPFGFLVYQMLLKLLHMYFSPYLVLMMQKLRHGLLIPWRSGVKQKISVALYYLGILLEDMLQLNMLSR